MPDQDDDDDYGFDDDDLDHLPANTLHHLEANALRATQHPQHAYHPGRPAPASDYGLDDDDDGAELIDLNDASGPPPASPWVVTTQAPLPSQPQHADYSYADDDYDDGDQQSDSHHLLQRITQLEQDKARQTREANALREKLQTKSGEAEILRRRHDIETKRYERQLADQQHTHGTELARLRAEMDSLRREAESAQTDTMFHQYEAREAGIPRRTARIVPSKPTATLPPGSPAGMPRGAHPTRGPLADGFDDDDVVMASPSRHRDRPKTATPKAGKRKRHVIDQSPLPLPALQLSGPRSRPKEREPSLVAQVKIDTALLQHFRHDDRRFALLHRLLSHPSSIGTDRVLEALTKYAFPSSPTKKLSSIVYDALANMTIDNVHELALHLCHVFLDLWKRCQTEKYYAPTPIILDALHFILACEPVETTVEIAQRIVPLIIASIDLVADPISKAARGGDKAIADLYSPKQRQIAACIDVEDCLELLYLVATSCLSSSDPGAIVRLWQAIPSSFTLMLLVKEQPVEQMTIMLRILGTSALTTSVGPINTADPAADNQANNEDALINRLTNLFTETPKPVPDPAASPTYTIPVSEAELWDLRLLVLSVLTQFSIFEYGSCRLAQNRLCIGRLIKYLDHCITSIYPHPIAPTQDYKVNSINATMKLIHHLATSNPKFDIKTKLVNTLGGQHAYLVALTRLAFSEGLVLESGIEDEVVNMAHDILDEGLSMEEGDAFGKVFNSGSTA
ncbi:hypothetical protein GGP41_002014 [Bipolaris sorokiniana]|uniref:DNA repair protein Rad26 n=1 Tax=Cochliobolus sativus TaxID=45130 RepID=A0A8H5ZML4_COCSA|nr:hypothetical protein GGP41_002014 [Bipolaris sorokiniana]